MIKFKQFIENKNTSLNQSLVDAARDNNLSRVKQLISKGADPNAWGHEALTSPGSFGYFEVFKYLLDNSTGVKDGTLSYILTNASHNGGLEVVKYLINKGIKLDIEKLHDGSYGEQYIKDVFNNVADAVGQDWIYNNYPEHMKYLDNIDPKYSHVKLVSKFGMFNPKE